MRTMLKFTAVVGATLATTLLSGCAYDYLQRTDRVGYSAGDAVKANMAKQTIDPSKKSMNSTKGLGKDGVVATTPDIVIVETGAPAAQ